MIGPLIVRRLGPTLQVKCPGRCAQRSTLAEGDGWEGFPAWWLRVRLTNWTYEWSYETPLRFVIIAKYLTMLMENALNAISAQIYWEK